MTHQELNQLLISTGFPVAYSHFNVSESKPAPNPPFIAFLFVNDSDFKADSTNYAEISNYQVELYTSIKHPPTEVILQEKLKQAEITYTKTETWLNDQNLYQIVYEIQLLGS